MGFLAVSDVAIKAAEGYGNEKGKYNSSPLIAPETLCKFQFGKVAAHSRSAASGTVQACDLVKNAGQRVTVACKDVINNACCPKSSKHYKYLKGTFSHVLTVGWRELLSCSARSG